MPKFRIVTKDGGQHIREAEDNVAALVAAQREFGERRVTQVFPATDPTPKEAKAKTRKRRK